jgi:dihydrofolate synthase/folylpolyglutamate synthase
MRALLTALGNPHERAAVVHIAGTNGKGSTAALIAAAAAAGGVRVGLFTSPHLHSMRERIRIGMEPIGAAAFVAAFDAVQEAAQRRADPRLAQPTTLETLTAMAFLHFAQAGVQLQVVEAFVGGRDDLTNVVQPTLSVITNISLDHVEALGSSLRAIASAKAGILKPGAAAIVGPQSRAALQVVRAEARRLGNRVRYVPSWSVRIRSRLRATTGAENRAVAATALRHLGRRGFRTRRAARARAWRQLQWPARGECLQTSPTRVLADGAHCKSAMRRLARDLKRAARGRSVYVVFGGQVGHDVLGTATELLALRPRLLLLAASRHPRAIPVDDLAEQLRPLPAPAQHRNASVASALDRARAVARPNDLILVTGSLAVAAEAREALVTGLAIDAQSMAIEPER